MPLFPEAYTYSKDILSSDRDSLALSLSLTPSLLRLLVNIDGVGEIFSSVREVIIEVKIHIYKFMFMYINIYG